MTVPTPDRLEREIRELIQALGYLEYEYRWAHGIAYSSQVSDQAHVQRATPNPTKAMAFDHFGLRDKLVSAVEVVRSTRSRTDAQIDILMSSIERDERRHGGLFEPLLNPRTATRQDLKEAREARTRRRARGDHVP